MSRGRVIDSGPQAVEVRLSLDPDGAPAILLQLPYGFVLIRKPADARGLADMLAAAAAAADLADLDASDDGGPS